MPGLLRPPQGGAACAGVILAINRAGPGITEMRLSATRANGKTGPAER